MEVIKISEDRLPELIGEAYLNLILLPTEKCNFRCTYCYEDFKVGKMSPAIINGIKELIKARINNLDVLEISWFGGEPLLGKEIIEEISAFILEVSPHKEDFVYKANITTNGFYLNEKVFLKLLSLGIYHYQITLDGHGDMHNTTTGVKNSFETIWENLSSIKNVDRNLRFSIEIRIHYCPDTWHKLQQLIELVNNSFSNDDRFVVYFKSLEKYGGQNDDSIKLFDFDTNKRIKKFLDSKLTRSTLKYRIPHENAFICYASKGTSFGVRANGQIIKCTVALNEERNNIGTINSNGTLNINDKKFKIWMEGLFTGNKAFLQCPNSQLRPKLNCTFIHLSEIDIINKWTLKE